MKKKVTISILVIVVILLAGWAVYSVSTSKGQSKQQTTEKVVKNSSTTKHVSSSSAQSSSSQSTATNQLDVNQLTPQQTVAALMYYAKENPQLHFERSWTNAFSNANVNTVYITTIDVDQLSEQGQNVRYALGGNDRDESLPVDSEYEYPSYTLDTDSTVHFYGNQDIGIDDGHQVKPDVSISLSKVVSDVNQHNAADSVKNRTNQLTIQDKRSASETSTANTLTEQDLGGAIGAKMLILYANDEYDLQISQYFAKGTFDVHEDGPYTTVVMEQAGTVFKAHDQSPRGDPKIPGNYAFETDGWQTPVTYGELVKYVNQHGGRQAIQRIHVKISYE